MCGYSSVLSNLALVSDGDHSQQIAVASNSGSLSENNKCVSGVYFTSFIHHIKIEGIFFLSEVSHDLPEQFHHVRALVCK